MKRIVFILTVVLYFGGVISAFAEPVALLLPYSDFGKQALTREGKTRADSIKEIPSKEEVGLPAYPGSYFGISGASNGVLSSIQMVSKDAPGEIIAWYKEQLGSSWQYSSDLATEQIGEIGVFVKSSNPSVSAFDALKSQQIRIAKVEEPEDTGFVAMVFDVSGVKTMINMQIKPIM